MSALRSGPRNSRRRSLAREHRHALHAVPISFSNASRLAQDRCTRTSSRSRCRPAALGWRPPRLLPLAIPRRRSARSGFHLPQAPPQSAPPRRRPGDADHSVFAQGRRADRCGLPPIALQIGCSCPRHSRNRGALAVAPRATDRAANRHGECRYELSAGAAARAPPAATPTAAPPSSVMNSRRFIRSPRRRGRAAWSELRGRAPWRS